MNTKEQQFIKLIEQNQGLIYKVSSLYTNRKEDRDDLKQEIAYQLWKSFDSFEHRSNISTWLYRVSMNTAIQFLKKEGRNIKKRPLNNEEFLIEDDLDNQKEEAIQKLFSSIQNLDTFEKGLILLYLEEKSHKEIAVIVGVSVSNVGTRIQRIKQKLKKII